MIFVSTKEDIPLKLMLSFKDDMTTGLDDLKTVGLLNSLYIFYGFELFTCEPNEFCNLFSLATLI